MADAKKTTKKAAKEAELIVEAVVTPADEPIESDKDTKSTAKAGKRSAKATQEAEAKQAKQSKKSDAKADENQAKPAPKTVRSKAERAGKKYRQASKLVESTKLYSLSEALELAIKTNPAKFDASVEMHINLGVDPKQADQNIRETVVLPAGTGKTVRIAVLAEADDAAKAKKAGADLVDADKIFAELEKETINFDVLIAIPAMMARLGKFARLLGPRGLMPNPKSGTVTNNVETAVTEAKAGRVEYRVDQAGIIHLAVGKVSFTPQKLQQNAEAVLSSVRAAKPASLKGIYVKSVYVTSSMGPSIRLELAGS